jgi:hypothetical protein
MIRTAVLLILIGFAFTACVQNTIFGKCSPYSKPGTRCVK